MHGCVPALGKYIERILAQGAVVAMDRSEHLQHNHETASALWWTRPSFEVRSHRVMYLNVTQSQPRLIGFTVTPLVRRKPTTQALACQSHPHQRSLQSHLRYRARQRCKVPPPAQARRLVVADSHPHIVPARRVEREGFASRMQILPPIR
ncbi:hypothetical protein BC830DRAFT_423169 [Chytriomyces sp. MP71]|nr:hypothetical protein BC830DRAFT_423169 [Chytriomyces sp. MP71]